MSQVTLKQRLAQNEVTIGSWMSLGGPSIAEIMADAGFDWLVIDLEHTPITIREAEDLIRVVDLKGLPALVRLSANDPIQIKRVLDAGARGILVPSVNSAAEAAAAVDAAYYPPKGRRGVGLGRAQGWGPGFAEYLEEIGRELVVIAQIEHVDAVNNLEEILAVPGIDGTIIGPYDLSGSIGQPGEFGHPDVRSLLDRYEAVSQAMGKPMGTHVVEPDPRLVREKIADGYTFLAFSTDFLFLGHGCRSAVASLRLDRDGSVSP